MRRHPPLPTCTDPLLPYPPLFRSRVMRLGPPLTLKTNAHVGLEAAWAVFAASTEQPLPRKAAIAVAAPVEGDVVKLTNSSWVIRPSQLSQRLGLDQIGRAHV